MFCYVMIEYFLEGCKASFNIAGVTLNQQYAYNWLNTEPPEFIKREVKQVPYIL